ncbi:TPA: hypothetical protein H1V70_004608 [Salmonella enterica]|nr:hypothetical protein [Salmonella enterica]
MKKTMIASLVALSALASGMANAADPNAGTIDLTFEGTVSTQTCALEPSVNNQANTKVRLGQTDKTKLGAEIDVVFKPTAASAAACGGATSNFVMQWEGAGKSAFGANGLSAETGSAASDSFVVIKAVNAATNNNTMANTEGFQYEFNKDKVTTDGLQYKVALQGGSVVGDMTAAATVKHWYK